MLLIIRQREDKIGPRLAVTYIAYFKSEMEQIDAIISLI